MTVNSIRCSATETKPTHHMTLSDGTTTVGLIAVNGQTEPDFNAIRREPFPRSTFRMNNSGGPLSEQKPPYGDFERTTWIGGMGEENAESDSTKYWFGKNVWTCVDGKLILAPRVAQAKLPWTCENGRNFNTPGGASMSITSGYGTIAVKFTTTEAVTVYGLRFYGKVYIEGGTSITARIYTNSGDLPNTLVCGATISSTSISGTNKPDRSFTAVLSSSATLSATTTYWFVVDRGNSASTVALYGSFTGAFTTKVANEVGTWVTSSQDVIFELITESISKGKLFTYKEGQYCITKEGATVRTYINGSRGACADNTGQLTKLITGHLNGVDMAWTSDEWIGAIVKIIEGPGKGEWRRITDNDATTLTVSPAWNTIHTVASSFVIKYTTKWTEITGHTLTDFTDLCISNQDVIYVAQGGTNHIFYFRSYNNAGDWLDWASAGCRDVDDTCEGDLVAFAYDQKVGSVIWRAQNGAPAKVSKATAPAWSTHLTFGADINIGGSEEIRGLCSWDGKLAITKTDSIWMVLNDVPEKLSVDLKGTADYACGRGPVVSSPYMMFPYRNSIERLLGQVLEDFGPKLPYTYNMPINAILPIVGGLIVGRSAFRIRDGYTTNLGHGSVQIYRSNGWHPVADLDEGNCVYDLSFQSLDSQQDMLWILTTNGIFAQRHYRTWDYYEDNTYKTATSSGFEKSEMFGWLMTGSFTISNRALSKWAEDIKIFCYSSVLSSYAYITPYCMPISTEYAGRMTDFEGTNASAFTKLTLASTSIATIRTKCKQIYFVINLNWIPEEVSAVTIEGYSVNYLARIDDADTWMIPVCVQDFGLDLEGKRQDDIYSGVPASMYNIQTKLDTWARDVTPLTMRSLDATDDNKRVLIARTGRQGLYFDESATVANRDQRYKYMTQIQLYEVT